MSVFLLDILYIRMTSNSTGRALYKNSNDIDGSFVIGKSILLFSLPSLSAIVGATDSIVSRAHC